ncbi:MAG: ATP-binding cassette domain-containing protein, partial [Pseudomonadota bacterium]
VYALFPKLVERRRQIARTMSGGEQQMVAIGRAIMSSPQVLMLDEPSLGLSPLLCKELFANLGKIKTLGIGVLMVEQNAKQSLAIADRGYLLENAKIVHEDTADALMQSSAVQAAYLGGSAAETPAPTPAAASVKPAEIPAAPVANGFGQQRKNASVLAGADISDLVARAGSAARLPGAPVPAATPTPTQISSPDAAPANADIAAMLREFEIAAERARQPRPAPAARSAPAAAPPTQPEPVTVEVYRAPRIEIYRRQPSGSFERN